MSDLKISSNTEEMADELIKNLKSRFKITDLGVPEYVIGIHIDYNKEKRKPKLNKSTIVYRNTR